MNLVINQIFFGQGGCEKILEKESGSVHSLFVHEEQETEWLAVVDILNNVR